jgi:hypothetical protein
VHIQQVSPPTTVRASWFLTRFQRRQLQWWRNICHEVPGHTHVWSSECSLGLRHLRGVASCTIYANIINSNKLFLGQVYPALSLTPFETLCRRNRYSLCSVLPKREQPYNLDGARRHSHVFSGVSSIIWKKKDGCFFNLGCKGDYCLDLRKRPSS